MAVFHRKTWGKLKWNSSLPCLQTRKGTESLTTCYKKRGYRIFTTVTIHVCACSIKLLDRSERAPVQIFSLYPLKRRGVDAFYLVIKGCSITHQIWRYYIHCQNVVVCSLATHLSRNASKGQNVFEKALRGKGYQLNWKQVTKKQQINTQKANCNISCGMPVKLQSKIK